MSAAHSGPSARIIAETVQKVEDGVKPVRFRIVAGRGIDVVIAIIAHNPRSIEVPVNHTVRHVVHFPGQGSRSGHVHDTLGVEQVGLHHGIGRVDQADTVGHKRVTVKIRFQGRCCDAPYALFVLLHGQTLGPLKREKDLPGVRSAETEGDAAVRVHLWRDN